jgi:hypothetical protein
VAATPFDCDPELECLAYDRPPTGEKRSISKFEVQYGKFKKHDDHRDNGATVVSYGSFDLHVDVAYICYLHRYVINI